MHYVFSMRNLTMRRLGRRRCPLFVKGSNALDTGEVHNGDLDAGKRGLNDVESSSESAVAIYGCKD